MTHKKEIEDLAFLVPLSTNDMKGNFGGKDVSVQKQLHWLLLLTVDLFCLDVSCVSLFCCQSCLQLETFFLSCSVVESCACVALLSRSLLMKILETKGEFLFKSSYKSVNGLL